MRYRNQSITSYALTVCLWIALSVVWTLHAMHHPSMSNNIVAIICLLATTLKTLTYWLVYWEFTPNSFVQRRLWKYVEQGYPEITYAGRITGKLAGAKSVTRWVEVRSSDDRKAIATPSQYQEFLAELHKHLPPEVIHL
jgi:hypothetical protein